MSDTSLSDSLSAALAAAPTLRGAPGLAVAAAGDPDPAGTAQALGYATKTTAINKAVGQHDPGVISKVFGWLGHQVGRAAHDVSNDVIDPIARDVVAPAFHVANAGLQEVQHQYRYLHDVEARHGWMAALGEGIVIAGAATGAGLLDAATFGLAAPLINPITGGEAAAGVLGRTVYTDSWDRTTSGKNYRGHYEGPQGLGTTSDQGHYFGDPGDVSVGRDLTSALHVRKIWGLAGVLDAVADMTMDPLAVLGEGVQDAKAAKLSLTGGADLVGKVDKARDVSAGYRRALDFISTHSGPEIADRFPKLNASATAVEANAAKAGVQLEGETPSVIRMLGDAKTPEEAHQVFREVADRLQILTSGDSLPSVNLTRIPFTAARQGLIDVPAVKTMLRYIPDYLDPVTLDVSNKTFNIADDSAAKGIYRIGLMGMPQREAAQIADDFLHAGVEERQTILDNVIIKSAAAKAKLGKMTDEDVKQLAARYKNMTTGPGEGVFGTGPDGHDISKRMVNGVEEPQAMLEGQLGKAAFPDFIAWKRMSEVMANARRLADNGQTWRDTLDVPGAGSARDKAAVWLRNRPGAIDDFVYDHYTGSVFKKLVLLSGGFAARVSAAETLPVFLRHPTMIRDAFEAHAGQYAWQAEQEATAIAMKAKLESIGAPSLGLNPAAESVLKGTGLDMGAKDTINKVIHGPAMLGNNPSEALLNKMPEVRQALQDKMAELGAQVSAPPEGFSSRDIRALIHDHRSALNGLDQIATNNEDVLRSRFIPGQIKGLQKRIDQMQLGPIQAQVWRVMKGVGMDDSARVEKFVKMIASTGSMAAPGISAVGDGHLGVDISGEQEKALIELRHASQKAPQRMVQGDDFKVFVRKDPEFIDRWQSAVTEQSKSKMASAGAKAWVQAQRDGVTGVEVHRLVESAIREQIEAMPEAQRAMFARSIPDDTGADPIADWAHVNRVGLQGVVHGDNNEINQDVLEAIAKGHGLTREQLETRADEFLPTGVKGRVGHPDLASPIDRIANAGFRRVLNPIVDWLSREPIYANEWIRQYEQLEVNVKSGMMTDQEAVQLSHTRAVANVQPFIHNPRERSQFAQTSRNWMPFYFAQEQAYRRAFRLLEEDPAAFRRYQLATSALVNPGAHITDENGKQFLMFPGAGLLANGTAEILSKTFGIKIAGSLPVGFSGQLRSLDTVLPFAEGAKGLRPRFGPVVAIAAHELGNLYPKAIPAATSLVGPEAMAGSAWDQLIPNQTLKNLAGAAGLSPSYHRTMQNSILASIQALSYQQDTAMGEWVKAGHSPTDPGHPDIVPDSTDPIKQRDFINRIKNQSQINFLVKAIIGSVAPAAPTVDIGDAGLKAEVRDQITKHGLSVGIQNFLDKHPYATAYTVFQSDSPAHNNPPATAAAGDYYNANKAILDKYPYAGAWFLPQGRGGNFDHAVFNEQLAQHLRELKTPEQFLKDLYISAGNNDFYTPNTGSLAVHKEEIKKLTAAGDAAGVTAENKNFAAYVTQFGMAHPDWWDDFKSQDRVHQRQEAVTQLTKMFADGVAPPGPMTDALSSLVKDYATYRNQLQPGVTDAGIGAVRKQAKAQWQKYLDDLVSQQPELGAVVHKVFYEL